MGELLHGSGGSGAAPGTRPTAAPRRGTGLETLVRNPGGPPASPGVMRASLLLADLVLTGGAASHALTPPAPDWLTTTAALVAVLVGGWLGWLGLTWGREAA